MEGGFKPRVWVTAINCPFPLEADYIQKQGYQQAWSGNQYYGATLKAYQLLMSKFGYSLVHVTSEGTNAFWMRNDVLEQIKPFIFKNTGNLYALYKCAFENDRLPNPEQTWDSAKKHLEEGPLKKSEL